MTTSAPPGRLAVSYVLPLRRWRTEPVDELAAYLEELSRWVTEVLVVDGSAADVFDAHRAALPPAVRHLPVDRGTWRGRNGKVPGVLTGVWDARCEAVVIADDDVRYDRATLARVVARLDRAHLVRPQNVFDPRPWHAWWDTGRTLLNRAVAADYPGTFGLRRSALVATDGYDRDVLFENLELIRTIDAAGGTVADAPDLYVRRRPPSARHFRGQRVRQAYDSFASPGRLAIELAVAPATVLAVATGRRRWVAAGALAVVAAAERGRRRAGGAAVFPPTTALAAPLWLAERAVCSWLAVAGRLRGRGVRYAGTTLQRAATPPRVLRRRLDGRLAGPVAASPGVVERPDPAPGSTVAV